LIAAEAVRCSYAEEGHAACEGAGEHEKRPAAAAGKLHRAARRDDDDDDDNDNDNDRSGSGRGAFTHRRDERQALAVAEEASGPGDRRGCRGVLAGSRRLRRHRQQVSLVVPRRCHRRRGRGFTAQHLDGTRDRTRWLSRVRGFPPTVTRRVSSNRHLAGDDARSRSIPDPRAGNTSRDREFRSSPSSTRCTHTISINISLENKNRLE